MPQGLQVWDASANSIFDTTFNTSRLLGIIRGVGTSGTSGSISDPMFSTGRPFYLVSPKITGQSSYGFSYVPTFDISVQGNTLTWAVYNYVNPNSDCGSIIYGVY